MNFYNPYNFVPAPPRDNAPPGLGNSKPAGHHRWHPKLWSGRIAVRMTTISPLLLVTTMPEKDGDPKWHRRLAVPSIVDEDSTERIDLAPTQIKGMLRAAFEAVTNSRFGVVSKDHHNPLGYRSDVSSGSGLRPVIVEQVEGRPRVTVLGDLHPGTGLSPVPGAVLEAWQHPTRDSATATDVLGEVHHRQHVEATLVGDTITTAKGQQMCRWRVADVVPVGATSPDRPGGGETWARVRGYLHLTGPTIEKKRWERLFITELLDGSRDVRLDEHRRLSVSDSGELLGGLRQLIHDQRRVHTSADRDGVWHREHPIGNSHLPWEYFGHEPGSTAWSRHLYDISDPPEGAPPRSAPGWTGPDGSPDQPPPSGGYTCWAEVRGDRLRPVMVSRLLYDRSPFDLLHESLRPAESLDDLSPADRVFGWVAPRSSRQRPRQAHRGQLRVVRVTAPAVSKETVSDHPDGKILPALSSPKPTQGRFYLSEDNNGLKPLRSTRDRFFGPQQALRGRKVYLYRRGSRDDRVTPSGTGYDENRTTQNSTVHSWVNAQVEFGFELVVDNLTDLELGALLWLLDPRWLGRDGNPGRLRLGMGKPYGFGVVELSLIEDRTTLARGDRIAQRLATLDPAPVNDSGWAGLAGRFEGAVGEGPFAPVLHAVHAAAAGVGKSSQVHYPRSNSDDDGYKWFVDEEKAAVNERKEAEGGSKVEGGSKAQPLPLLEAPAGTLKGHR